MGSWLQEGFIWTENLEKAMLHSRKQMAKGGTGGLHHAAALRWDFLPQQSIKALITSKNV